MNDEANESNGVDGLFADRRRANELQRQLADLHMKLGLPPGHRSSPIPDIDRLTSGHEDVFRVPAPEEVLAIDFNDANQVSLAQRLGAFAKHDFAASPGERYERVIDEYPVGDAFILDLFLRYFRPKRVVCLGAGPALAVLLDTSERHFEGTLDVSVVDPDLVETPRFLLERDLATIAVLDEPLGTVPYEIFSNLAVDDIVILTSSHVAKAGSDVNFALFEALPRLPAGVAINIQEIPYAFSYPLESLLARRFWNEAYFVRAFLSNNDAYRITFWHDFLRQYHPELYNELIPNGYNIAGRSLWLSKIKVTVPYRPEARD